MQSSKTTKFESLSCLSKLWSARLNWPLSWKFWPPNLRKLLSAAPRFWSLCRNFARGYFGFRNGSPMSFGSLPGSESVGRKPRQKSQRSRVRECKPGNLVPEWPDELPPVYDESLHWRPPLKPTKHPLTAEPVVPTPQAQTYFSTACSRYFPALKRGGFFYLILLPNGQ